MPSTAQVQTFGEVHVGQGATLTINQVVQISVAEIKTRAFVESSPYVGLRRFEERNKDFFYGRDYLVAQLLDLIAQRNLILVAGASGSGKSSVLRAGLLPQLSQRLPQGRFRALLLTPDRDPFAALRSALQSAGIAHRNLDALSEATARSVVQTLSTQRPPDEQWLLLIDQFEEIFTLCTDSVRRAAFLSGLTELSQAPSSELKIVLAMRADFFDRLGPYPDFGALAQAGLQLVLDMPGSALRAVIEQPAARHGVVFEAGLVEQIIADVSGRPGALPLLQYTLDLLWRADHPADDRTLSAASYHGIGGIEGALQLRADSLYRYKDAARSIVRPPEEKEALRQIFLRLVDLTSQGPDARAVSKRTRMDAFTRAEERTLISELIDEKLLVSNADSKSAPGSLPSTGTVEIAHEALLAAWPQLKTWIEEAREVLYVRNQLTADARRYREVQDTSPHRAEDELWGGTRLERAQKLREDGDFDTVLGGLLPEESAFLDASRRRETLLAEEKAAREAQLRKTRRTLLLGGAVSALLIIVGLGFGLWEQRRRTQVANAAAEREREVGRREQQAAENSRQELLASYVEKARQLFFVEQKPYEALPWLHRAQRDGSRSPLLGEIMASVSRAPELPRLVLLGHEAELTTAAFSPDGQRIVTASKDTKARVFDAKSGRLLFVLHHEGVPYGLTNQLNGTGTTVWSAAYSPDGLRIVTASDSGIASVFDATKGRALLTLKGSGPSVTDAAFSPDGKRIAVESATVRIYDAASGQLLSELKPEAPHTVTSTKWSADGSRLVTAGSDQLARIWDPASGRLLLRLKGHTATINSAAFSPDGRRIVTASSDQTARIFDARTGRLENTLMGHARGVESADFSPDGRFVVTASLDKTARIWDADTASLLRDLSGHQDDLHGATFSPDGRTILTNGFRDGARVWDADSGRLLAKLHTNDSIVKSTSYRFDGRYVVTADADRTARVWEIHSARLQASLSAHESGVRSARFRSDGRRVVTASDDKTARIWDTDSGRLLVTLSGHTGEVRTAELSPDGSRVVTASADKTARIWDADSGRLQTEYKGHQGEVESAMWSPDGKQVASTDGNAGLHIWDASTGRLQAELGQEEDHLTQAVYSPDGTRLVAISRSGSARVWEVKTGRLVCEERGHLYRITDVSWSPDGTRVVTASQDTTARVFDAQSGELITILKGHTKLLSSASFSPDGQLIVTASDDKTARIWNATTGLIHADLRGHESIVLSAAWSPSGHRVLTAGADRTARIWDGKTGRLLTILAGHGRSIVRAVWSPKDALVLTASHDRTARIWNVAPDERSPDQIAKLVRCYVPFRFAQTDSDVLVPSKPDPTECQTPSSK